MKYIIHTLQDLKKIHLMYHEIFQLNLGISLNLIIVYRAGIRVEYVGQRPK